MRISKSAAPVPAPFVPLSCLEQAEICREQARDAVRLKRFQAAFGLFSTAATLCKHAAQEGADDAQVQACLGAIELEIATYSEFARAFKRPLQRAASLSERKFQSPSK